MKTTTTNKRAQLEQALKVHEHTLANLKSSACLVPEYIERSQQIVDRLKAQLRAFESPNTSEMTYSERYAVTAGWEARHIAKDLMEMNGAGEFISERDDQRIEEAEQRDKPYLAEPIEKCFDLMGLMR
jgi:hypothetical protein